MRLFHDVATLSVAELDRRYPGWQLMANKAGPAFWRRVNHAAARIRNDERRKGQRHPQVRKKK